jgi:hypothetical protein
LVVSDDEQIIGTLYADQEAIRVVVVRALIRPPLDSWRLTADSFRLFRRFGWGLFLLPVLLAGRLAAWSCDLCAIYGAMEAQSQSGQGFFGGAAEQFTYFGTFQSGGHNAPNPDGEQLNSLISQAFVGYNVSERFGVQFNLPIIYRDYSKVGAHGSETGIGGHDLTLGSGSFDGLVGTALYTRWKRLFLTGSMQYAIRTEGDFGYQFANDWMWFGGPGVYLGMGLKYTLALQAVVSGESKGEDTINGVASDDTAITSVYLGPQINFTWSDRLSAQIAADLPVSITSSGQQIVPDYRVRAALTWRF